MYDMYADDNIDKCTTQKWIKRFNSGDFDLEDKERSGSSMKINIGK